MLGLEHKQKIGKIQLEKNDVSCDHFGAFRSQIGKDSGGLGALLEPLGGLPGTSGAIWSPPGAHMGTILTHFGSILDPFWDRFGLIF